MVKQPEAYVPDTSLSAFEQELHILRYFRENMTENPKKLLKMADRVRGQLPTFIQRSLCDTIKETKDPVKWLKRAFDEMDQYPVLMKQLMDEGCHGMVFYKGTLHGIRLDTNPKWLAEKKDWAPDQELEIIDEALFAWMEQQRLRHFKGKLVLFSNFGFSGIPYVMDQYLKDAYWAKLEAQWEKEDREKLDRELMEALKQKS